MKKKNEDETYLDLVLPAMQEDFIKFVSPYSKEDVAKFLFIFCALNKLFPPDVYQAMFDVFNKQ